MGAVSNCTTALHLALRAVGVGPVAQQADWRLPSGDRRTLVWRSFSRSCFFGMAEFDPLLDYSLKGAGLLTVPEVFDGDPRPFHGVMPYENGKMQSWSYSRV